MAADAERGWLLTRDMRGRALAETDWPEALRRFAEIQAGETAHLARWRAIGYRERKAKALAAAAARLLVEVPRLLAGGGALEAAAAEELAAARPAAVALCERLQGLGPRLSIPSRGSARRQRHAVARPAGVLRLGRHRDCAPVLQPTQRFLDDLPEAAAARWAEDGDLAASDRRTAMQDAYLEPWQALAPRSRLLAAFASRVSCSRSTSCLRYDEAVDLAAGLAAGAAPQEEMEPGAVGDRDAARGEPHLGAVTGGGGQAVQDRRDEGGVGIDVGVGHHVFVAAGALVGAHLAGDQLAPVAAPVARRRLGRRRSGRCGARIRWTLAAAVPWCSRRSRNWM